MENAGQKLRKIQDNPSLSGMRWLLLVALLAACADAQQSSTRQLIPVPKEARFSDGRLPVEATFPAEICPTSGPRARHGFDRALRRLEGRTGFTFLRNANFSFVALLVCSQGPGQTVQGMDEDESYSLNIHNGMGELRAATDVGVLRGLETLLQLLEVDRNGFYFPEVSIQDKPRFPWRGLLIDVCRHWEPVEVIKRNLDGMAAVKLNVFHWHLSEDQGFRVESRVFPKLQELGSDGLYYTQEQIRDVVAYARDRGIRVVPEFDMPGHSTSWFVGYPQFSSGPGPYQLERNFGVAYPVFDPTREEVYEFIDSFIGEMAPLFPDAYWHVGGDEVENKQWDSNPAIQAFKQKHKLKDNAALQTYFNERLFHILQKHGKKMVGWDEILNPNLPKDIVVQSWRGAESLSAGARQGYNGILSAGYYLDHNKTAAEHYLVDPLPDSGLTASESSRILGGEACMWGESIDPEKIDSRIWPRAAAIAERLWSEREVKDIDDMYRRLAIVNPRLEELGLLHIAYPEILLRRYATPSAIVPLRSMLRLLEPANPFTRGQSQFTPLTSLTDVAIPDPPEGLEMEQLVEAVLKDPEDRRRREIEELAQHFRRWQRFPVDLSFSADSPRLKEAQDLADDVAKLGSLGSQALTYLAERKSSPSDWTQQSLEFLRRLEETKGIVRIAVTAPMRKLILAAASGRTAQKP